MDQTSLHSISKPLEYYAKLSETRKKFIITNPHEDVNSEKYITRSHKKHLTRELLKTF